MALIHSDVFEPLFSQFHGLHIGYVQLEGNVGDALIALAARSLFSHFGISLVHVNGEQIREKSVPDGLDELVVSGGGNLGTFYKVCYQLRQATLECGLPVTILPQSFVTFDEDLSRFKQVYVRETVSLAVDRSFRLMPDLALGLKDLNNVQSPEFDLGVFLREDEESIFESRDLSLVDPITNNNGPLEYIEFASRFAHLVTDRLHFAIAGLIAGRTVTLLPNSTPKNRAMYDTWLRDLGCEWSPHPHGYSYEKSALTESLWTRLTPAPRTTLPWHAACTQNNTFQATNEHDHVALRDESGNIVAKLDANAHAVWSLCDGQRGIADIGTLIADAYAEPVTRVAEDVLSTVNQLHLCGALVRPPRRELLIEILANCTKDGWTYRRASVRHPDRQQQELWFGVPVAQESDLSGSSDCFVIATLMQAMADGLSLRLEGGAVSPGLIENLIQFQEPWIHWRRQLSEIGIRAEVAGVAASESRKCIAAFSGGLDSCFTLLQHNRVHVSGLVPVDAVLMVHGFDIPLTDREGFEKAVARGRRISDDVDVPMLLLRTNFRGMRGRHSWDDSHGTGLAAALTIYSGGFSSGIISSTMNRDFQAVWGSNSTTDPLLGSDDFRIVHYGFEDTRLQKFKALADWPAAIENLRVCWKYEYRDQNCGRCHKCVLTQLSLLCLDLPTTCFERPLDDHDLALHIPRKYPGGLNRHDLLELAAYCTEKNIETSWADVLRELYAG